MQRSFVQVAADSGQEQSRERISAIQRGNASELALGPCAVHLKNVDILTEHMTDVCARMGIWMCINGC